MTFDLSKAITLSHPAKVMLISFLPFDFSFHFTLSLLEEQSHVQDVFLEVVRIYESGITRKTVFLLVIENRLEVS